ncbi:MAG: LPS export ABC transporter protein LptC [Alphaproteobacteria bacterium]|jgi:LPS export ABC transporter protein LptC
MVTPFVWIFVADYSNNKIVVNFMENIGSQPLNLSFENLTIKTFQSQNNSVVLKAPKARLYDLKISKIDLEKPIIKLYEPGKPITILSAQSGVYQAKDNKITLSSNVILSKNKIYQLTTDTLFVDLNNFAITMPKGVNALYKNNSLKAKNVEFNKKSNKAIFKGGIKLRINPNAS